MCNNISRVTVLVTSFSVSIIKGLHSGISVCVGKHARQCVRVCVCECVRGAAAFPYVVHAWLV